jgi:hypothetical protein
MGVYMPFRLVKGPYIGYLLYRADFREAILLASDTEIYL